MALGQVFLPVLPFFTCHYHSTNIPYSCSCRCYQMDELAKPGNLPKSNVLSKLGNNAYRSFYIFTSLVRLLIGEETTLFHRDTILCSPKPFLHTVSCLPATLHLIVLPYLQTHRLPTIMHSTAAFPRLVYLINALYKIQENRPTVNTASFFGKE